MGFSGYKCGFMLLLLLADGLFLLRLERREHFALRAGITLAALLLVTVLFPLQYQGLWSDALLYLCFFVTILLGMWVCFNEPFVNLLFCGIAGYTVQHLGFLLYCIPNDIIGVGDVFGVFIGSGTGARLTDPRLLVLEGLLYVLAYVSAYGLAFFCFDPKLRSFRSLHLGRTGMLFLTGLLVMADIVFNLITNYYTHGLRAAVLLERCYNILLCLLILVLLYNQLTRGALRDELLAVQYVLEQGKHQYELAKKNIELINIKYHDLRHQSERLRQKGLAREEQQELDRILNGYAAQMHTGNEVLDVILTEKTILCQGKGIQLMSVAEGQGFGFIKVHQLYALLGNALDNAIEAVADLPQEKRAISLLVRRQGNLAHIHVENPCTAPLVVRNGLPATTKGSHDYHGFGMLSIRTIAEQYGGEMSYRVEDGVFSLDVVLVDETGTPFPEPKQENA